MVTLYRQHSHYAHFVLHARYSLLCSTSCSHFAGGTHIMPSLCSMPDIAYYAQHYARPISAALMSPPNFKLGEYW